MAVLKIKIVPDSILRQKALPIKNINGEVADLMRDMLETMYKANGIGLAANQVGSLHRVLVADVSDSRDGSEALMMANPEIIWEDPEETYTCFEGCLSIPGRGAEGDRLRGNVTRPRRVRVKYLDIKGEPKEVEAEDLFSSVLQHEIDHLDGILFVDYLSKLKRDMILRKSEKAGREMGGEFEPE